MARVTTCNGYVDQMAEEYRRAYLELLRQSIGGFRNTDPLIGGMSSHTTRHDGLIRNVDGPIPLDQPLREVATEEQILTEVFRNADVEGHTAFLAKLGQSLTDGAHKGFLQTVDEVTDATGQSVDHQGAMLSWEVILDTFESYHFTFDKEGRPIMPTIVLHPDAMAVLDRQPRTEEQAQRFEQIILGKREKWAKDQEERRTRLQKLEERVRNI